MGKSEKIKYAGYMLYYLLPVLKRLNQEQFMEMKIEAQIRGAISQNFTSIILKYMLITIFYSNSNV